MKKRFILLLLAGIAAVSSANDAEVRSCLGSQSGLSMGADRIDHYSQMFRRYRNCTRVKGNLEITGIESPMMDVSFLKNIKEVTGYVIIALNFVPYLSLENLRIIRGRELFHNHSLLITVNYNKEDPKQGLKELGLKSLTEIVRGNVKIRQNPQLCFADTINWQDILNPAAKKDGWEINVESNSSSETCGSCYESCDGHCWGKNRSMCQITTLENCSSACGSARCYGPRKEECCDAECAGGCIGPKNTDCLFCLHVNNSGACEHSCPPVMIFDTQTQTQVNNPHYRVQYQDLCLDKCPDNLLIDQGSCVKSCRKDYHNNGNGTCVECTNNECGKECFGIGNPNGPLATEATVDASNIKYFKGCNIVNGNIIFQAHAFQGDKWANVPPLTAADLAESLKDVEVITGYLRISGWSKELTDFSVFKNLQRIDGVDLYHDVIALTIHDSHTSPPYYLNHTTSLGFTSLKQLTHGNVYIGYLRNLCYDRLVNWTSIVKAPVSSKIFTKGVLLRNNKPADQCQNVTCHPFCENGCWGPEPNQCLSCRSNSYNGTCLDGCSFNLGIYEVSGEKECATCDSHCNLTCTGPGPGNCSTCKLYRFNGTCVDECPIHEYPNPITKECNPCHDNCGIHEDDHQCTGPSSTLGEGGCNFCDYATTTRKLDTDQCLPVGQRCPPGYYELARAVPLLQAKQTCVPCYDGCSNCTGFSKEDCLHLNRFPILVVVLVPVITGILLVPVALALIYMFCGKRQKDRENSMRLV